MNKESKPDQKKTPKAGARCVFGINKGWELQAVRQLDKNTGLLYSSMFKEDPKSNPE